MTADTAGVDSRPSTPTHTCDRERTFNAYIGREAGHQSAPHALSLCRRAGTYEDKHMAFSVGLGSLAQHGCWLLCPGTKSSEGGLQG